MSTACCGSIVGGTTRSTAYQDLLDMPASASSSAFHCSFLTPRGFTCKPVQSLAFTKETRPRKMWQIHTANYALHFVTETIWPAVTNIASFAFGLAEYQRDDRPQLTEATYNAFILNWVVTVIANRLQLSPGDVLLDTKLENMVFLGGNCDSNFRTVESLMDIEDLFSVIIHPNYVETLASYTVRELADRIASQYLLSIQTSLTDNSYNHNIFLLERMLQSAMGNALNVKEPLKLDTKLSSYPASPRSLKQSLKDLEGKFGLSLDYDTSKDLTIQNLAKRIMSQYKFDSP